MVDGMKSKNVGIIYDDDADGVLSAVILLKTKYPINKNLYPSSNSKLYSTLSSVKDKYKRLYILDIGINLNNTKLYECVKQISDSGVEIFWFDAHSDTLKAMYEFGYSGFVCYKKGCATASLVHDVFGNKKTKGYQKMAAIIDQEIQVQKDDPFRIEADILSGSLISISSREDYNEVIFEILENPGKSFSKMSFKEKFLKNGQKKADRARYWLYTNTPEFGDEETGPAIWITDEVDLFEDVSGKALSTLSYKRNSICMLIRHKENDEGQYRFNVRAPKTENKDWRSSIIEIANVLGGSGDGHPRAFAGQIPAEVEEEFILKVSEEMEDYYSK